MLQPSAERGDWMTIGQSDAGKKEGVECGRVRNEAVFGPSKLSGKKRGGKSRGKQGNGAVATGARRRMSGNGKQKGAKKKSRATESLD